jgi:drug/metabolite transporter (DMT)-like permease
MSRRAVLLFVALSLIWGVPYLFIRVAVDHLDPTVLVFGRCLVGALTLLPFTVRRPGSRAVLRRWRVVLLYTCVEVAGPWWLLSDAEQHVSSSFAGLMICLVPLLGAVFGLLLHDDDRLDGRRAAGLLIGLVGIVLLLGIDVNRLSPWPVLEVTLTATGYALGPFIVDRALSDLPAIDVNLVVLAIAALGYLPFAVLRRPDQVPPIQAVLSVVVLGVACTAVAFLLIFALIGEIGPARATVITYVNPAVAIAAGVVLLGEPLTAGMLIGFPLVLAGSMLATWRRGRRESMTAEPVVPAA